MAKRGRRRWLLFIVLAGLFGLGGWGVTRMWDGGLLADTAPATDADTNAVAGNSAGARAGTSVGGAAATAPVGGAAAGGGAATAGLIGANAQATGISQGTVVPASGPAGREAGAAATLPAVLPPAPADFPTATPAEREQARLAYERGAAAQDQSNLIEARRLLSEALAGGALPDELAAQCRRRLTQVAQVLTFSPEVYPNDPEAYHYTVKPGDTLYDVVRREQLFVSHEGVMLINRMSSASRLRIGQAVKLVRGPFDVVVTKHTYTLDLYQHGMFVKSYRVGLGAEGSTPVGAWVVSDRVRRATWTSPEGRLYKYGDEGYPLGREGFWLALRGTDDNTRYFQGFGIHGTNEPDSIGRDASLGCVRLLDDDIAEVFALLYPEKSTVTIRP